MPATEMLKATEAAVVARVSLRDVNRVIDERILPETLVSVENGRFVLGAACTLIAFYFESAKRLTSEERLFAIRSAEPRLRRWNRAATEAMLKADWTVRHDFLTIDLLPFFERSVARLERLDAAREVVTISDDIMGGTPVISGTRVPVHDVAAALAAGVPAKEILEDYPSLTEDRLELAALYAEANPLRGRPKPLIARLPEGARILSDHRVPRRRAG
ncbi:MULTISPECIES: DUF433 domain-containing protein [Alphaproteobacteria]|jgi:uncharacterized protein (DUF433 family)|uniref:DUF433 domain-containing protein n=5 Tax=Paracoccus TaxID=265 RepID=A0A5C6S3W8_9RHOB|nr:MULTISPECIES: DUF433 domain-containing protein [Alphaproteobacteria]MCV0383052.1 DUF433 domain-containing protein [Erythrobacter sp.]HRY05885.1 DUF433 domain-containing protein [Hyphomicrobiaceae bacterium]ARC35520.1 DUF433 domain-containing protein [Paracoccus yeei]AZY93308.1 DUF433 domain-containing protein [Paracoccus sp. Arc7-R13]MBO6763753.1 DUF433 domain-containing protein [Maricaulis sp.]|tara:strand:+ start:1338 stop:1988 length:651 start_codon:yes stop_codon:yes gene_type:complete